MRDNFFLQFAAFIIVMVCGIFGVTMIMSSLALPEPIGGSLYALALVVFSIALVTLAWD